MYVQAVRVRVFLCAVTHLHIWVHKYIWILGHGHVYAHVYMYIYGEE